MACTLGGSEYRGAHDRVDALPLRFVTENAYLSSPGEYQYELFLKAKDHSETYQMADFSVFAKDRLAAWLIVALGAIVLGGLNLWATLR